MPIPTTLAEYAERYPTTRALQWVRVTGSPRFDYPIDYEVAVLDVDVAAGRIDFLSRWAPQAYCHFHRHLGETSVLVLEGEHNVVEEGATETVHKQRKPGFFATNPAVTCTWSMVGPRGAGLFQLPGRRRQVVRRTDPHGEGAEYRDDRGFH